jgi:prevent-host-death family protein
MNSVNMLEAKTHLSKYVEAVEQGLESEVIIARNGRPVAKLVPVGFEQATQRVGVAKGAFDVPETIDRSNAEVAKLFLGDH